MFYTADRGQTHYMATQQTLPLVQLPNPTLFPATKILMVKSSTLYIYVNLIMDHNNTCMYQNMCMHSAYNDGLSHSEIAPF